MAEAGLTPRPSSREVLGVVDVALIGLDGPAVVISAETAFYLERTCRVAELRQRLRDGQHPQISQELLDLRRVAMEFDPTRLPEVGRGFAEVAPESETWLSVSVVADSLGLTDRAVRLACSQGRLEAERVGGRWQITEQAFENFKAARAA